VFPNPNRDDPGKALRDWDLWGPFFFIVFLGLTLSWSASVKKVSTLFPFTNLFDSIQIMNYIMLLFVWFYDFDVEACYSN
jgi:hypothetical protein